jgi:hypothetical protein
MRSISAFLGAVALAGLTVVAPGGAVAELGEHGSTDAIAFRKAEAEFIALREDLARVNAEIASLKRAERSVRDDYRLRDRMADAEALAQKVGRAEARLRAIDRTSARRPGEPPLAPPPQASPQDGTVELEAKADLFADEASRLERQADAFARAAEHLRTRQALRRRAGTWDRDPFAGLESSKRNLAVSASSSKSDGSRNGTTSGTPLALPPASGGNGTSGAGAIDSPGSKPSPLAPTVGAEHAVEQRLYLDPATAAELRQALGSGATSTDPEALDRAATALRARARQLDQQADSLRRKSRAP